jgi:hypothetical protein
MPESMSCSATFAGPRPPTSSQINENTAQKQLVFQGMLLHAKDLLRHLEDSEVK